jgi:hypothetical protein
MSHLVTKNVWRAITRSAKQRPGRCWVAVAYFGTGASKLLPLTRGSTLIVNMSEESVRSGLTDPKEVLHLLNRGVDVHSVMGQQPFADQRAHEFSPANGLPEDLVLSGAAARISIGGDASGPTAEWRGRVPVTSGDTYEMAKEAAEPCAQEHLIEASDGMVTCSGA